MLQPRRRLALLIEYDGAPYVGSQLQANGPSIQGELERAVEAMTGRFARLAFAGRTDAGVHALGQVATFDTEAVYEREAFVGGLNVRLPLAIAVRDAREVSGDFDPRRQAVARRYRYTIMNSPTRSPLARERAWQVRPPLDLGVMAEAADLLLGEHDFAAFAPPEASRLSTYRQIYRTKVCSRGRRITIDLEANAFLMHQVRRTAAALVEVGSGRLEIAGFARRLQEAQPGSYTQTAPAHGLCLLAVKYQPPLFGQGREQQ